MTDADARLPIDADLDPEGRVGGRAATMAVVALGGMCGAALRQLVSEWFPSAAREVPWGTALVNVGGSFALGVVLVALTRRAPDRRLLRAFLATGVLGSLTTMSTYQVEVVLLADDGEALLAVGHLGGVLVLGLAAAWWGMSVGRRWVTAP